MSDGARRVGVFVVEDDPWMRQSLEKVMAWPSSRVQHVASAASGTEALAIIRQGLRADVALVDIGLPDLPGTDVIRALRERCPTTIPVVFTVRDDREVIVSAFRSGALGYLLKSAPIQEVLDGLLEAADGGSPMTPKIARLVIELMAADGPKRSPTTIAELTPRETEVLTLLARGQTYPAVADALGIGLGTVQGHVKHIYEKLQVESKAEAATWASRMGLV